MAFTTKLNLVDAKFYQSAAGTLDLSGSTSIGEAQYLTDKSGSYVARSVPDAAYVTGLTNSLETSKVSCSDFNTYTGATDTTLTGLRSDLDTVSGQTDTNTSNISTNTSNIAQNASDIANLGAVSGLTEAAITGVTNGLTKVGSNDAKLGGLMTENTTITVTGTTTFDIAKGVGASGTDGFWFDAANAAVVSKSSSNFECYSTAYLTHICANFYSFNTNAGTCSCMGLGADGQIDFVSSDAIVITSDNSCPAVYAGDYSAGFSNPRAIPDAAWVTGQTGAISAANGLTRSGDNIILGGTLCANTDINLSTFDLKFSGDSVQYTGDYSGTYVARSLPDAAYVTGLTSGLETCLQNQIDYLSGQTDLRLTISDFNSYTATTDTRLDGIETDVAQNASDISNLGAISGITNNSITGVTNGLTKVGSHSAKLGGALTESTELSAGTNNFKISGANVSSFIDYLASGTMRMQVRCEDTQCYQAGILTQATSTFGRMN